MHASLLVADSSGCGATSASVTTLFLNRRSSRSSEEHLELGLRKAWGSATCSLHTPWQVLSWGAVGSMLGWWVLQVEEGVWDTDPEERS